MHTEVLRVLEYNESERKATVLLQRGRVMFIGLVVERHRANKQYHCVYIGISRNQYRLLAKDQEFADRASFLGITGGCVDAKKLLCDKLLIDQPTHYVGEVTPKDNKLDTCLTFLADVVYNQLDSINASL